ncbi:MAG: hypothetical protein KH415_05330 [Clostridium sp.]|nr:hypothetical protein [Clostridium sp.]
MILLRKDIRYLTMDNMILHLKQKTKLNNIINNNKNLLSIYSILLVAAIILRSDLIQNIIGIILNCVLILILINKFKIDDKRFKVLSYLILLLNIILIYWGYFSSIKLGFDDGLITGKIGEFVYNDTSNYYYGSEGMIYIWKNEFINWISGNSSKTAYFYGFYNFFVIWNAILRIIFGDSLNFMILIKLQFSIASIFFLYKISLRILNLKYSRLSVLIMNIFPGYLLVNMSLLRDNLMLFLILYATYIIIEYECSLTRKLLIKFILIIAVLTYMRVYIGIALSIALVVYFYWGKIKSYKDIKGLKKIILSLGIIILIVGFICLKMGYGFLGIDLIMNAGSELPRFDESKLETPFKFVFWLFYHLFFGGRGNFDFSGYIGNFMNSTSNIFIIAIALPSLIAIFLKKNSVNFNYYRYVVMTLVLSLLTSGIVVFTFSSIIPRLYIAWFWSQIIVFLGLMQNLEGYNKLYKWFKILYSIYIVICVLFILK